LRIFSVLECHTSCQRSSSFPVRPHSPFSCRIVHDKAYDSNETLRIEANPILTSTEHRPSSPRTFGVNRSTLATSLTILIILPGVLRTFTGVMQCILIQPRQLDRASIPNTCSESAFSDSTERTRIFMKPNTIYPPRWSVRGKR